MAEEKIVPMRDEFPRWYRQVDMSGNRDRLEARWKGVVDLIQKADAQSIEAIIAVAFRTKPRPRSASLALLREPFKAADDLFDMDGNNRELEILCGTALATLFESDGDTVARAALATTTAAYLGARTTNFPLDLIAAAEATISRLAEDRRTRPDLMNSLIQKITSVGLDQDAIDNLKQNPNGDNIVATLNAMTTQTNTAVNEVAKRLNATVQSMNTFIAIQDEELQMLWWLFGGRSKKRDCPFANLPEEAQPIVLAAEVADTTQFLPGPISVKPILSRAGLKERKKVSIPAAVNACSEDMLADLVNGVEPSPITKPLHFAIERKLETRDEVSWVAGWSAITGIDSDYAIPSIELSNLFYRERLDVLIRS